jgi:hypothetical protein
VSGDDRARVAEVATKIAHDVGKYVARMARNLPPGDGPAPAALVGMLAKDLYETRAGMRASAVLDALAGEAAEIAGDARVKRARVLLAEADGIETAVRAGEAAAVRRGAAIALEVEGLLRDVAVSAKREAGAGTGTGTGRGGT